MRADWKDRGHRKLSRDQHQAPPLNTEDLAALAAVTPAPLAGLTLAGDARAVRDLAFAAVAYDLMARPSVLVGLRWEKIDSRRTPRAVPTTGCRARRPISWARAPSCT